MTTFPAAGFRVTRYDARGYGDSTRPDARPYSHVHDLAALIDALGISLAALVGCSMGGSIGIDFTLEHPERVWALVPVAAGLGGFELLEQEEDWWAAATAPVDEALEAGIWSARRTPGSRSGHLSARTIRPVRGSVSWRSRT